MKKKSAFPVPVRALLALALAACAGRAAADRPFFSLKEWKGSPLYTGDDAKYTDAYEQRVNVWPLVYHRAPVTSVIWPVFSVSDDHFMIRPLYSQYRQNGASSPYSEFNLLYPLAQFDTLNGTGHVFPLFWYKSAANTKSFYALLWLGGYSSKYPYNSSTHWLFPLYFKDASGFYSLPYYSDDSSWSFLLFLAGGSSNRGGSAWALPFYWGHGWNTFNPRAKQLEGDTLPDDVRFKTVSERRDAGSVRLTGGYVSAARSHKFLFLYGFDSSVRGWLLEEDAEARKAREAAGAQALTEEALLAGRKYQMQRKDVWGDVIFGEYSPFFSSTQTRTAVFDASTREKERTAYASETRLLYVLFNRERRIDQDGDYARDSALWIGSWGAYNYERRTDGRVSLDIFPGFTYDSRPDGYSKTSFLWRFFRYENDPASGKKVDLFFIPVYR